MNCVFAGGVLWQLVVSMGHERNGKEVMPVFVRRSFLDSVEGGAVEGGQHKNATRISILFALFIFLVSPPVMGASVTFTGSGSSTVSLSNFHWGYTVDVPVIGGVTVGQWSSLSATLNPGLATQSFTVGDGKYKEIEFFTLQSAGAGWGTYDIYASLGFDNQSISTGVAGDGSWGAVNWHIPYFWDPWNGTYFFDGGITGGKLDWDSNSIDYFLPESWVLDFDTGSILGVPTDYFDLVDLSDNYQLIDNNMIGVFFEDGLDMGVSDTLTVHAYIVNFGEREPSPVAEPGTIALLSLGLLGLGVTARRRLH